MPQINEFCLPKKKSLQRDTEIPRKLCWLHPLVGILMFYSRRSGLCCWVDLPPDLLRVHIIALFGENVQSGGAGEPPPHAPTEPDVTVSRHPAPLIQPIENTQTTSFALYKQFLLRLRGVDHSIRPDKLTPSLHLHYRDFITTTS
jgi:hypothetical protein